MTDPMPQDPANGRATPHVLAGVLTPTPGLSVGWMQVARAFTDVIDPASVGRVWIFPPLRRDGREWGTAVLTSRGGPDRFVVFTGKYMLTTRGRRRGQARVEVAEVGEGPAEVVDDVVRGVQQRSGEGEPPIEIRPELWFASDDDESTAET